MSKPRPTLRLVIGLLCAAVVLVVAVITLAITYSVSLQTVRDVGKKHTLALATTARVQVENYFDTPTKHLNMLARAFLQDDIYMPADDPKQAVPGRADRHFDLIYAAFASADFRYSSLGYIFDDGSGTNFYHHDTDIVRCMTRFSYQWPHGGDMLLSVRVLSRTNFTELNILKEEATLNIDARFAAYATAKLVAGTSRQGLWYPVSLFQVGVSGEQVVSFMIPGVAPLYNKTGNFLGFASLAQPLGVIADFLQAVKGTPNTEAFAVTADGYILASTHATPFATMTQMPSAAPVPSGCATSAATSYNLSLPVWHGCRKHVTQFTAYPPLVEAAKDMSFITTSNSKTQILKAGGKNYFVSSASVPNSYRYWGLNIVLSMPESDVLGDIVKGRNTAIGITAAVFICASLLSFGLVYALLQPLSKVSKQMMSTAKLRDVQDDKAYSSLAEIQALQKAFSNMNTAIQSFTRYVPRDVVKDLMSSGQLCTIQMVPQRCTMLFVDIAGFTTVCERVPPDVLSQLVSLYFDRASRIVMEHDGLIDKFIGDCIMAVWGAPFGVSNQEVKATLVAALLNRETNVDPLSTAWDEAGELLRVRVGVSTGVVLAGNMGSADRMNYTVIGDPVNLAARLESMNKYFGTRVMVSEETADGLGGVFVLRLLMPIAVVGKEQPVKVYEVMGLARQLPPADIERFQEADATVGVGDDTTDTGTVVSVTHDSTTSAIAMRRSRAATATLIREAGIRTNHSHPLTCTVEEEELAQQHTIAVQLYTKRDFAGALQQLALIEKNTPAHLLSEEGDVKAQRTSYAGKSIAMVRDLCEKYLKEGCPDDFNGVYRALEK